MSRSYNSRRGHYGCSCRRPQWLEDYRRGKQNKKRNLIKFDGQLSVFRRNTGCKWWKSSKVIWKGSYYYDIAIKSKESYRNWSWLKGRPNSKGWYCQQYVTAYENGKWGKIYYPCQ